MQLPQVDVPVGQQSRELPDCQAAGSSQHAAAAQLRCGGHGCTVAAARGCSIKLDIDSRQQGGHVMWVGKRQSWQPRDLWDLAESAKDCCCAVALPIPLTTRTELSAKVARMSPYDMGCSVTAGECSCIQGS